MARHKTNFSLGRAGPEVPIFGCRVAVQRRRKHLAVEGGKKKGRRKEKRKEEGKKEGRRKKGKEEEKNRNAEALLGIGTLMPNLRGVVRGGGVMSGGGASAPKGDDAPCPDHLHILPSRRAGGGRGGT